MSINEKIKVYIEERGINLTHLAKKVEMSKQNLSSILSNDDIKLSQLQKICAALEVPVTYFFSEDTGSTEIQEPDLKYLQSPGRFIRKHNQAKEDDDFWKEQIRLKDQLLLDEKERLKRCEAELERLKNGGTPVYGQ